jgi:hypothetical protein
MGILFSFLETISVDSDEEKSIDSILSCRMEDEKVVDSDDEVLVDNNFQAEYVGMVVDDDDLNVLIDNTNFYAVEEGNAEEKKDEHSLIEAENVPNAVGNESDFNRQRGVHEFEFVLHGYGSMVWSTGMKYDGNFCRGRRHGFGTMVYANGDTYAGMWKFDQRDGRGMYFQPRGDTIQAYWRDDIIVPGSVVVCVD